MKKKILLKRLKKNGGRGKHIHKTSTFNVIETQVFQKIIHRQRLYWTQSACYIPPELPPNSEIVPWIQRIHVSVLKHAGLSTTFQIHGRTLLWQVVNIQLGTVFIPYSWCQAIDGGLRVGILQRLPSFSESLGWLLIMKS